MPQEVEIRLVANNKDAVKGIRETEQASQKLHNTQEQNQKRQIGLIADVEKELGKLQAAQKNAMSIEAIAKYNQKIAEAKQALKEYNEAGVKANDSIKKSTETVLTTVGKWIAGLGLVAKLFDSLKQSFTETVGGIKLITQATEVWQQALYNVVTVNTSLNNGLAQSLAIGKQLNALRVKERVDLVDVAKKQNEFNKLYFEASDRRKTDTERLKLLNEAMKVHNERIEIQVENVYEDLIINQQRLAIRPKSNKLLDEEAQLLARLAEIEGMRWSETRRIEGTRTQLLEQTHQDQLKRWHDEIEAQNKANEEKEKEETRHRKRMAELQGQLLLANERDPEKQKLIQLQIDRDRQLAETTNTKELLLIWENYYASLEKLQEESNKKQSDAAWDFALDLAKKQKEALQKAAKEEYDAREAARVLAEQQAEDEKESRIQAFRDTISQMANIAGEILEGQVEAAQRNREILDTQIAEAQRSLDDEIELYKAGYASNVDSKKKEIEQLQTLRARALAEEEEALKKQQRLDTILQTGNLITSSTEIFKSFSKIPIVGIPLAIAMIATMFAAFASAKTKAKESSGFAKGGWTGSGGEKDHTGERVAGVVHGEEFVVKKGPAHKFRDVLEAINRNDRRSIFNSFEKISPDGTVNNVIVQNDGPNQRLDEVNSNLRKLGAKEEIIRSGNITIVRKGSTTRIIKR